MGGITLTLAQDILTGDEIISDSYDLKEIDGVAYEADCRKITIGGEQFGGCPRSESRIQQTNTTQTLVPMLPPRSKRRVPRTKPSRRSTSSTPSA